MKVHGWRALLAAGAMLFGTTAVAGGGAKAQEDASLEQQEVESQQGLGGSGAEGSESAPPQGEVEMESEEGMGGSGESSWEEGTGGSGTGTGGSTGMGTGSSTGQGNNKPQTGAQGGQTGSQTGSQSGSQSGSKMGSTGSQQQGQPGGQMAQSGQSGLSGDVVEKRGDVVFLRLDQGAIIPVKVNNQTQATLSEKDGQLKGQQAVKKLNVGDKVNVELKSEKGSNIAQSIQLDQSGQGQQELQGKVASVQGNWINIEHESGALVPLKVDKQTQFQGQGQQGKQVSSVSQIKEGQDVRASFRAEGTVNAAESIEVTGQGMGGAGEEGFEESQPQEEPMPSEPIDPGTGGAGNDPMLDDPMPEDSENPAPMNDLPTSEDPAMGEEF